MLWNIRTSGRGALIDTITPQMLQLSVSKAPALLELVVSQWVGFLERATH